MRGFQMASGMLYGYKAKISGIRKVFKSEEVQTALQNICDPITERANATKVRKNAEYATYVDIGRYTAIGKVVCDNIDARHDNAANNTILKAR